MIRTRIVAAFAMGVGVGLSSLIPVAMLVTWPISVTVYIGVLLYLARPLRFYGPPLWLALAASAGAALSAFTLILTYAFDALYRSHSLVLLQSVVVFAAFLALGYSALAAAVYIHNRRWPVQPTGHCARCGHCLTGLGSNRCPECGTVFVPSQAHSVIESASRFDQ